MKIFSQEFFAKLPYDCCRNVYAAMADYSINFGRSTRISLKYGNIGAQKLFKIAYFLNKKFSALIWLEFISQISLTTQKKKCDSRFEGKNLKNPK